MKNRLVWKIGDTALDMWDTLQQMRHQVDASPDVYLDDNFLRNLNIQQQDWDLADKDDFFACMEQENLLNLTPTDPLEGFTLYEDVKYPNADPPDYLSDLEDAAEEIPAFFKKLNEAKCSEDGRGFAYVKDPSIWEPHATRGFETYLCQWGRPDAATPIHELSHVFHNNDPNRKSHRVYFAWHGDEGKDRVIQRSEAQILITGIKGTMNQPHLCMHNVPVRVPPSASPLRAILINFVQVTTPLRPWPQSPNHDRSLQPRDKDPPYQMQQVRAIQRLREEREDRKQRWPREACRLRGQAGLVLSMAQSYLSREYISRGLKGWARVCNGTPPGDTEVGAVQATAQASRVSETDERMKFGLRCT